MLLSKVKYKGEKSPLYNLTWSEISLEALIFTAQSLRAYQGKSLIITD